MSKDAASHLQNLGVEPRAGGPPEGAAGELGVVASQPEVLNERKDILATCISTPPWVSHTWVWLV